MRTRLLAVLVVGLVVAVAGGCGPKKGGAAGGGGDPALPAGETVVVTSSDGVEIHGDFYAHAGKTGVPVVLLLHMYSHERRSWAPLVPGLHAAGYAVLAIDLRGHGESTKMGAETLRYDTLMKHPAGNQFLNMHLDVAAVRDWLAKRSDLDLARLGIVSASVGTSVALDVCARDAAVKAAVLMTPGKSYFAFPTMEHSKAVKQPLLVLAADEEREGAEAIAADKPEGAAPRTLMLKPSVGHGTKMFGPWPEVKTMIVDWIKAHV